MTLRTQEARMREWLSTLDPRAWREVWDRPDHFGRNEIWQAELLRYATSEQLATLAAEDLLP